MAVPGIQNEYSFIMALSTPHCGMPLHNVEAPELAVVSLNSVRVYT